MKHTKKDEVREICWSNFCNIFQEKYMSEIFFDRKVKEFHELRMGSMTMDAFIKIFLYLLHYVPYIKDEKVKIQQLLGCIPPNVWERIEFDIPKTLDTTLHKDRICYEHGQLRQGNLNINIDKYKNFSNNCKLGFSPPLYRKRTIVFQPIRTSTNRVQSHMY